MTICSCVNLSLLLGKFSCSIGHSRSKIEWSCFLKCLTTGDPLLLAWMPFCNCPYNLKLVDIYIYVCVYMYVYKTVKHKLMDTLIQWNEQNIP